MTLGSETLFNRSYARCAMPSGFQYPASMTSFCRVPGRVRSPNSQADQGSHRASIIDRDALVPGSKRSIAGCGFDSKTVDQGVRVSCVSRMNGGNSSRRRPHRVTK